ncbi:RBR-type E3 ubiquitin transferase [Mycena venus]|uniref:RBR-type E3 ubiquitin transferase n=1 Tax=Mycena venus TaxID=2733690 RepID=A0A8H6U0M7_9AGAR|nr:RBR-type E3 ubiquitin transferase [Mycena venus]
MFQSLPGFSQSLAVHEDVSLKIVYHSFAYILIFPRDRMEIDDSDDEHRPRKPVTHGIRLASCRHYFCGACLARAIYLRLNIKFDPATYGTVLGPPVVDKPGLHAKWPVYCPTCIKPEVQHVPLSDVTVLEVLGKPNIEEWNHARLLSTLELIQCPHEGCEEAFPLPTKAPSPTCSVHGVAVPCVKRANMTCEKYRAIPITERTPEDADFMNLAKQEKWRRCPNCSAMVELKFGCNYRVCLYFVCLPSFSPDPSSVTSVGLPLSTRTEGTGVQEERIAPISVRTPEDADFLYLMSLAKQEKIIDAYDGHINTNKIALQQTREGIQGMGPPSYTWILPLSPHLHSTREANPWMCARIDRMEIDDSDDEGEPRKPVTHGIRLASCRHYFCGACLAQAIYLRLNIKFDPTTYGTVLGPPVAAKPGLHAKWPTCMKPEAQCAPLSDVTALQVLGKPNIEDWNHRRFLSMLNLIQCPHKGCEEAFPSDEGSEPLMQCPRCGGSLCHVCKCVWHENMTCESYQAMPISERTPEDPDFMNLAKQVKWRRCPNCSTVVELKFGFNHITCVCEHHFCYTCGAPFEYENGRYRCTGGENCVVWEEQKVDDY